jgi:hypothetical protein
MFTLFALKRRNIGAYALAGVAILVLGAFVAPVAGQITGPGASRVPTPNIQVPSNPWHGQNPVEQANQWWEESQRNSGRDFPSFPNVKKTVKHMEDAATGTTAAVLIAAGIVVLLVGLYLFRLFSPAAHTRHSTLDDPCVRAYMAALEANNAPAKLEQAKPVGQRES